MRKWYGLKRGNDIIMVMSRQKGDREIIKNDFYNHDIPISPDLFDKVVPIKLVIVNGNSPAVCSVQETCNGFPEKCGCCTRGWNDMFEPKE